MVAQFRAPSTTPISQAHEKIAKNVAASTGHIQQAQVIVKEVQVADPAVKLQLDNVRNLLDEALADNKMAELGRAAAEDEVTKLDVQLKDMTDQANNVAIAYNKLMPKLEAAQARGNAWLKRCIYLGVACAGLLAWTFKGPLMALGGI